MINKLVVFLIKRKLHLKENERFEFTNQKELCNYCFSKSKLVKCCPTKNISANVSLNWLLDKDCKIIKVPLERLK